MSSTLGKGEISSLMSRGEHHGIGSWHASMWETICQITGWSFFHSLAVCFVLVSACWAGQSTKRESAKELAGPSSVPLHLAKAAASCFACSRLKYVWCLHSKWREDNTFKVAGFKSTLDFSGGNLKREVLNGFERDPVSSFSFSWRKLSGLWS